MGSVVCGSFVVRGTNLGVLGIIPVKGRAEQMEKSVHFSASHERRGFDSMKGLQVMFQVFG